MVVFLSGFLELDESAKRTPAPTWGQPSPQGSAVRPMCYPCGQPLAQQTSALVRCIIVARRSPQGSSVSSSTQ
eukprot:6977630-Pyramimonas_sp.AAC.1